MKNMLLFLLLFPFFLFSQKTVSITIDDVPNTRQFEKDSFQSVLLDRLDSMDIPVAIFINEGLIYQTNEVVKNFGLLNDWVKNDIITLGNHSYSHARYSEVDIDSFQIEIERGEAITKALAERHQKPLKHFRFPYNDLGKDSIQHKAVKDFLKSKNYRLTPFTVESSDWMFSFLYNYYLDKNKTKEAQRIGEEYVKMTLEVFQFFETLSQEQYGRNIRQIYLCHDNALNAKYLPVLVDTLKEKGYTFNSLDKALEDSIYLQQDNYNKKWGVSWFYRWMKIHKERIAIMREEPEFKSILEEYERVKKEVAKKNK